MEWPAHLPIVGGGGVTWTMSSLASTERKREGNSLVDFRDHYGGGGGSGTCKASSWVSCYWMTCWLRRTVRMSACRASISWLMVTRCSWVSNLNTSIRVVRS